MIITFSHPKGGVGKSTMCFNYMSYLQQSSRDFIGADLDGQHTISSFNKIREAKINAKEINTKDLEMKDIKPFNIKSFDVSESEAFLNFLRDNQEKNIIVDTGGFDSGINRLAITASDLVITPLSDTPPEVIRLLSFDNILNELETSVKKKNKDYELKAHILINNVNPQATRFDNIENLINKSKYYELMDNVIVRRRNIVSYSLADGIGVLESKITSDSDVNAKKEILAMCKEIDRLVIL